MNTRKIDMADNLRWRRLPAGRQAFARSLRELPVLDVTVPAVALVIPRLCV